ncbi:MAG: cyclic pyranopterin phosphate synthase [Cellvibrionaceae bacterium]|jgi:cyclic pyranopterin phosphate synthase
MLKDNFGRTINYLRISVTDRCDFRCVYCMAENMKFHPKQQLLTLEEIAQIAEVFATLGVTKIRVTGGEPLVRRNVLQLFDYLSKLSGLEELTLTTNGSRLASCAATLAECGVKRVNVSLDSLKSQRFKALTRTGDLDRVLEGIYAAISAGLRVKLNSIILKNRNIDEVLDLVDFALAKQLDICFIEEMPLGNIEEHRRAEEFVSSQGLRDIIKSKYTLLPDGAPRADAGPSRYWQVAGFDNRVGFISPHSDNFCASCNRVRLTATGNLLLCLGNEHSVNLKNIVREYPNDKERLQKAIVDSLGLKPEKHHFQLDGSVEILRFMNATGG